MIRLQKKTKMSPQETIDKAMAFFGPSGYGMDVSDQSKGSVRFEGAGGGVEIATYLEDKNTSVEVISREWEIQAREFMAKIN